MSTGHQAVALTVAGSDPSGGAGIQADLRIFEALGVRGASVITAVTAQNHTAVRSVHPLPARVVEAQLEAVMEVSTPAAAKSGMLARPRIVEVLASAVQAHRLAPLVVDPVLESTSGAVLLDRRAFPVLCARLLPLCHLVTPNLAEAAALAGFPVRTREDMESAAAAIAAMGPRAVLVTGGHLEGGEASDLLWRTGAGALWLEGRRIPVEATHGTGCALSAAVTAHLALGESIEDACRLAKELVSGALAAAVTCDAAPHRGG